ncbi:MAG: hypothetical protein P0S94_04795, partial [Simkaniaceae bacterium]|nr:hypothetical protein [Simkaniaceae bacterium]
KSKFGWLLSAALVMIVLNFFFIYRLLSTHKMMPAGMMAIVTTLLGIPLLAVLKREVSEMG